MDEVFRWETFPTANVKFEAPESWTVTNVSDDTVIVVSKEKDLDIEFIFIAGGFDHSRFDEARVRTYLESRLTELRIVKAPAPKTQHGLQGFGLAGAAVRDGKPVEWFSFSVGDGKGHGIMSLAVATTGGFMAHGPTLFRIIGSIQQITGGPGHAVN
jgi:hypothetical protein